MSRVCLERNYKLIKMLNCTNYFSGSLQEKRCNFDCYTDSSECLMLMWSGCEETHALLSHCTEAPFITLKPLVVPMGESPCLASYHVKCNARNSGSSVQKSFVEVAVNMQRYITSSREGEKLLLRLFLRTEPCKNLLTLKSFGFR